MKLLDIIFEDIDPYKELPKSSQEVLLNDLKTKFPNWDYSNSEIYIYNGRKTIKNIHCKIHDINFADEDKPLDFNNHKRGTGCKLCTKELLRDKYQKKPQGWIEDLSKVQKFKNKIDFSDLKFNYDNKPGGPIVSNFYCKIHNKYFNGGETNSGIRASRVIHRNNICPDCVNSNKRLNSVRSVEEWKEEFKENPNNKNFDFSKIEVWTLDDGHAYVYNVSCNVKGLNGKKHGMFAIEDENEINEGGLHSYYLKKGIYRCPKCVCENKQKDFLEKAVDKHKDKYLYDKVDFCDPNSIVKGKRKVLIGCTNHNKPLYFLQNPNNHWSKGQGCPICRESKGELYINSLLVSRFGSKYKILREKDATFEKLVGKKLPLPFDFYIPELNVLIEYDGEGHFEPTFGSSDFSRNDSYNKTFQNDNIKNSWIKSRSKNTTGIRLIRVPYVMEFNEIDAPLLEAIENTLPNQIKYIGEYPRRRGRKEVQSQFKLNESKLSLIKTLYNI
jgi:hypothetical protein